METQGIANSSESYRRISHGTTRSSKFHHCVGIYQVRDAGTSRRIAVRKNKNKWQKKK